MFKQLLVALITVGLSMQSLAITTHNLTPREAVYYWATKGFVEELKEVVKAGYSLDMMDKQGRTPLCDAVYNNDAIAFRTLLMAGANTKVSCLYSVPEATKTKFIEKR